LRYNKKMSRNKINFIFILFLFTDQIKNVFYAPVFASYLI